MGVFARLFRRSKTTEETSTAEALTDRPAAGSEAGEVPEAKASGESEAGAGTEPTSVPAPVSASGSAKKGDEGDASEAVEIPQQQSPGKAADSEADEGART